jgi:hypothetical protein
MHENTNGQREEVQKNAAMDKKRNIQMSFLL